MRVRDSFASGACIARLLQTAIARAGRPGANVLETSDAGS
jgi:hypothetical protein